MRWCSVTSSICLGDALKIKIEEVNRRRLVLWICIVLQAKGLLQQQTRHMQIKLNYQTFAYEPFQYHVYMIFYSCYISAIVRSWFRGMYRTMLLKDIFLSVQFAKHSLFCQQFKIPHIRMWSNGQTPHTRQRTYPLSGLIWWKKFNSPIKRADQAWPVSLCQCDQLTMEIDNIVLFLLHFQKHLKSAISLLSHLTFNEDNYPHKLSG